MNTERTLRAPKGHKLIRSWSGAGDSYARGRCECGGWVFRGWSERMQSVIRAHRGHCADVRKGVDKQT